MTVLIIVLVMTVIDDGDDEYDLCFSEASSHPLRFACGAGHEPGLSH